MDLARMPRPIHNRRRSLLRTHQLLWLDAHVMTERMQLPCRMIEAFQYIDQQRQLVAPIMAKRQEQNK